MAPLFGGRRTYIPMPAPEVIPEPVDTAAKEAAEREAVAIRKKKKGGLATIVTGPAGIEEVPGVLRKTLGA